MFSTLRNLRASVSLIVLASYLAAATFDCERPTIEPVRAPAVSQAMMSHSMPSVKRPEMAGHGGHGGPGMSRSEAMPSHVAQAEHAHAHRPGVPQHTAGQAETTEATDTTDATDVAIAAIMIPSCRCGCSETRSLVGGNAARLGAVVPDLALASLSEAPRQGGETPYEGRAREASRLIEPIPI